MRRWILISIYAAAAIALFVYRNSLSAWLQTDVSSWQHEGAVILAAFLIALVPAVPYGIIAVMLGAKYGAFAGSLINLGISVGAAAVLFLLVRYAFTPDQRRKAAEMKGLARFTALFERNAFMAVLFARLLPVVPAQAVTIYAALTRMNWLSYLTATLAGKVPFILMVTFIGEQLIEPSGWREILLAAVFYGVFLLMAGMAYRFFQSGKRAG